MRRVRTLLVIVLASGVGAGVGCVEGPGTDEPIPDRTEFERVRGDSSGFKSERPYSDNRSYIPSGRR